MKVLGPHVKQVDNCLVADYDYNHTKVEKKGSEIICTPLTSHYTFKTDITRPKLGVMFVGWGGNNGSTITAGILANKHNISWMNKRGKQTPNYYGSITQSSTMKIGCNGSEEIYLPLKDVLPLVKPEDIIIGGWDISSYNLGEALKRSQVLDYNLIEQLYPEMSKLKPLPAIYQEDYIAINQKDRADNIIQGSLEQKIEKVRQDIRDFKAKNNCSKIIVLWTATTERFTQIKKGVHDTYENLAKAIKENRETEISASTMYAIATILEGSSYINGSPQNTLVPALIELAKQKDVFIVGDDFKTGQTKIKTNLVDFLVTAGIKPQSIVSYNHLGNNDGKNLSSERQFKSKELTKKSCVDDILSSNKVLYPDSIKIDHEIVIKYVPFTGDSKKAMDEYCSSIFLNGLHTLVMYNVCEDSLLAAPIMLDLILLTEIFERIYYKTDEMQEFTRFNRVLSMLGYLTKCPVTDDKTPVVNSLSRQKNAIDNLFRACVGLKPDDNMLLEFRCPSISEEQKQQKQISNKQIQQVQFIQQQQQQKQEIEVKN